MDTCAQRYGWKNVMYRITWQNLNAMISDRVESVEKGDDEYGEDGGGIHITDYLKKNHGG